ncbi:MAG: hypothetical protein HWE21_12920 [Cytophagia bacterium]|nr:hypothetical protein [Cytophagia bacterium]
MKFRLIILLICILSLFETGLAQSTIINLDKNSTPFTNISEIVESVTPITFKVAKKEHQFIEIYDVLMLDNSIVVSVAPKATNGFQTKVFEFNNNGDFIRQIGGIFPGFITLSYDPNKKEIGINDGYGTHLYNEMGQSRGIIETTNYGTIYFDGFYWGVVTKEGEEDQSELTKYSPNGANKELVWTYTYNGQYPAYSFINNNMELSNKSDNVLYQLEDGEVKPKIQIKSKNKLSGGIKHVSDWIIISSIDSRRGARIFNLYSLKESKNYSAMHSKVKNDLLDGDLLRPFERGFLGHIPEKTICFISNTPNTSETSYTIYLAKLK